MKFLAVEFYTELKEFAVIALDKVLDGNLRSKEGKLVNKSINVQCGKNSYKVKVRGFGTEKQKDSLCDKLADDAANSDEIPCCSKAIEISAPETLSPAAKIKFILGKRNVDSSKGLSKKTKPDNDRDLNQIPEVVSPPLDIVSQHVDAPGDANVQELQATIDKLKARDSVELHSGSGIFLTKTTVAAAKLSSISPSILAGNLFRHLFTPEEMKEHSLFGRTSNANKASPALPAVV
ncbi:unnamed protein product [Allacma fusca]|uniref:BEN domain-containing protein n=1 Tax=Allacma fusca TaxID=39272 RepID=A0A8J2J275_9HEXA|nr:unnamed protein product [Allacma fusca]